MEKFKILLLMMNI